MGKIGGPNLIADDNHTETDTERPPSPSWGVGGRGETNEERFHFGVGQKGQQDPVGEPLFNVMDDHSGGDDICVDIFLRLVYSAAAPRREIGRRSLHTLRTISS